MKDVIVKLTIDDTGAIKSVKNMQSAIKDV